MPGHPGIVARLRAAGCVFAEDEAELLIAAAATPVELQRMVERRVEGLPLELVIGWADFCGLRVAVAPGVFVPRHRTEFLVEQALALSSSAAVVLDLCCGSGAVGMAVVASRPEKAELHAVDLDPVAVHCAQGNLGAVGGRVYQGDLYAPLPLSLRGRVDILVCNAPYVPTEAIAMLPREARSYEPALALDGGEDGCDVQQRVAAGAPDWLAARGVLLIETSRPQARRTAEIVAAAGLVATVRESAELEATVVVGHRRAVPAAR